MSGTALGILIEATRAAANTLRVLADTLEAAANRASWARGSSNPEQEAHPYRRLGHSQLRRLFGNSCSSLRALDKSGLRAGGISVPDHCIELCS